MQRPLRLSIALLLTTACGSPTDHDSVPPILTSLPRALSPAEVSVIDAANTFAFDLLKKATETLPVDSNVFLSPLSASMALSMALNGANGETLDSMRSVLRLSGLTELEVNEGYRDLITLLRELDSRTEMRVANSLWGHDGFHLEPEFLEKGRSFFDAELQTIDFGSPDALPTINDWVNDATNGRIPRLLDEIGEEILFLINAIYFKGKWRKTFDPGETENATFHGADGVDRTAPLMRQSETLLYYETDGYQAVDLLYGNGAFSMTVLLPKAGPPAELLASLDAAAWEALTANFTEQEISLILPKFRLEYSRKLKHDLAALGMAIAFDRDRADFYRIADVRPDRLYMTRVDQKTFVEVNEEGTEAAAATSVGVGVISAPPEMRVDRPFLFAIRERLSGTVLFLGVMNVIGS
ncbi:MAG TPA: serpin family protein [Gemmatimonadales bacterium]|nr:serpin family protein [Gemmatimonadales bacterium]